MEEKKNSLRSASFKGQAGQSGRRLDLLGHSWCTLPHGHGSCFDGRITHQSRLDSLDLCASIYGAPEAFVDSCMQFISPAVTAAYISLPLARWPLALHLKFLDSSHRHSSSSATVAAHSSAAPSPNPTRSLPSSSKTHPSSWQTINSHWPQAAQRCRSTSRSASGWGRSSSAKPTPSCSSSPVVRSRFRLAFAPCLVTKKSFIRLGGEGPFSSHRVQWGIPAGCLFSVVPNLAESGREYWGQVRRQHEECVSPEQRPQPQPRQVVCVFTPLDWLHIFTIDFCSCQFFDS